MVVLGSPSFIAIIGGGPSGLMAAEILAGAGHKVTIYDRMPSLARKFLIAGRGGLNLTHSEPLPSFIDRYGKAAGWLKPALDAFPPAALIKWCENHGQETFIGSSGRVFPKSLKASPLLRAWLRRLDKLGVAFALRHEWQGWDDQNKLIFKHGARLVTAKPDAVLLALGGASWPRLGSDGIWAKILGDQKIKIVPLRPANCGFIAPWSSLFADKFAGQPLKPVSATFGDTTLQGEVMITQQGLEGGVIYALSAALRDAIEAKGEAVLELDLRPGITEADIVQKLQAPRGSQSLSTYLRKSAGLSPLAIALMRESTRPLPETPKQLAALIKQTRIRLTAASSIARAISSAGGIVHSEIDGNFMLKKKPGCFASGEMLDWEAPTGGYLLQGCFSTAVAAARGVGLYLKALAR